MIIIISNTDDASTSQVIDWLLFFKKNFIRINDLNGIKINYFDVVKNEFEFEYDGIKIRNSDVTGYWYRRGVLKNDKINLSKVEEINDMFSKIWNQEKRVSLHFLLYTIESICPKNKRIGSFFNSNFNKLFQLRCAIESDLLVPDTILTTQINGYKDQWITKSLETVMEFIDDSYIMNYTNIVKHDSYESGLSYLQRNINKKFEIRSFYLHGNLYSMAIFSQKNKQTAVDFRRYDKNMPNRNVPLKLPEALNVKIRNFMNKLNLDTGSIDLIYTNENQFIFLEVNPIGQFGMTSQPCNYRIEKIIAETL